MKTTLKKRETMHLLCAKGLELFYEKGFYNTSLDDILKELSLSKGAFYHHFKSKDDFFINIIQNFVVQKVYALLVEPLGKHENPLHVIMDTMESALEPNNTNEMAYGFMLNDFLTEFTKRNSQIHRYLKDVINVWEVNLISVLKKGKLDGYIARHVDCEGVATFIIASFLGMRPFLDDEGDTQLRYRYAQQLRQYLNMLTVRQTVI